MAIQQDKPRWGGGGGGILDIFGWGVPLGL